MNPYEVSADPVWHRWVDGIVVLVIGFAAGLVVAQAILTTTVTTTETVRRVQTSGPQIESGASTELPSGFRLEES